MRHKYKGRKLGTDWSHTQAMKRSLVQALFLNDRIKTTETRAKEIRGDVDRIITWAKKGDLHSRRLAIAALGNNSELVREIFEKVAQGMFEGRNGGYTRIMKLGPRKGDGAPMVIMELVNETVVAKEAAAPKKATPKKKAAKKEETVIEEVKESVEAAEEAGAEEIQEAVEEQVAEEAAEVAAEEAKEEAKEEE
jgi:large subunit ribosomal protein L17